MQGTIFLWFEPSSEVAVRSAWQVFKDAGFDSETLHSYRPHLTLAVADDIDLQVLSRYLEDALQGLKQFTLNFANIGVFCNEALVVFLAPVQHRQLRAVRSAVIDALHASAATPLPYYREENWTPHLSLLLDVARADIGRALQLCERDEIPNQVGVISVGIVDSDGNDIASFSLAAS